jgi:hypothetical protein
MAKRMLRAYFAASAKQTDKTLHDSSDRISCTMTIHPSLIKLKI